MKKQAPTGIGACFIQRFKQRQTNLFFFNSRTDAYFVSSLTHS